MGRKGYSAFLLVFVILLIDLRAPRHLQRPMASVNKTQLALIPALEPPAGTVPDFSPSYFGLQPLSIAILSLCLIVTTLVVGARLVAKCFGVKAIQVEDCVSLSRKYTLD